MFIGVLTLTPRDPCHDTIRTYITPVTRLHSSCVAQMWKIILNRVMDAKDNAIDKLNQCLQAIFKDQMPPYIPRTNKEEFMAVELSEEDVVDVLHEMMYEEYYYILEIRPVEME